jgi:hypothetical protein
MNSQLWEKENNIKQQRLSEKVISYLIGKYVRVRYKIWMFRKEANEGELNPQDLSRVCSDHVLPVTSPLVLISQIQRSGGSLLSQLFDGHPQLHAHPDELKIGYPKKHIWPRIDLNDRPQRWFDLLFEDVVILHNRKGYAKGKKRSVTLPYVFATSLQRKIFLQYMDAVESATLRNVFDAYMTSYFGAWLSNQNYIGQKKFVTAFAPRLAMIKDNMELFFNIYPEGRLISLVRDPRNWFPSAKGHGSKKYVDIKGTLSQWEDNARAMLRNKEKYGDSVCLIQFEDLVSKTELVMRYLAEFLGIEFDEILLIPTFNKFPIRANTSFKLENPGILNAALTRYQTLTSDELNTIERMTSDTYPLVLNEVVRFE